MRDRLRERTRQALDPDQYLNSVPYGTVGGQTAIGVQAASRIFFDKPALAAEPRSSRRCSPGCRRRPLSTTRSATRPKPSAAATRCSTKMAQLHYIGPRAGGRGQGRAAGSGTRLLLLASAQEDFFFEYVRQKLGRTVRRAKTVAQGGLKVLHDDQPHMQRARAQSDRRRAERARRPGVGDRHDRPVQRLHRGDGRVREATSSPSTTSPPTGHRQPGSTFKAIVLADALSRGIDPNSTILRLAHAVAGLAARNTPPTK